MPAPRRLADLGFPFKGRSVDVQEVGKRLNVAAVVEGSVRKGPGFAAAYAGLADVYEVLPFFTSTPTSEVIPRAKAAALHALELDPALADAHATLGAIKTLYEWDWAGGRVPDGDRAQPQLRHRTPVALGAPAPSRYPEAIEAFEQAIAYTHNPSARGKIGPRAGGRGPNGRGPRDPEESRRRRADQLHPRLVDAMVQLGLGEKDLALDWLEKAQAERDREGPWLKVDPVWEALRGEPRFQRLLEKMGLADVAGADLAPDPGRA